MMHRVRDTLPAHAAWAGRYSTYPYVSRRFFRQQNRPQRPAPLSQVTGASIRFSLRSIRSMRRSIRSTQRDTLATVPSI